jgi:predicted acetyltransferase
MTPTLTIDRVGPESNEILVNLFEHYLHDMAEWFKPEVRNDGRYGYDMAPHWENRDPVYLMRADSALAGFAIVGSAVRWTGNIDERDVREFFILPRHRRSGFGEILARRIWDDHPGQWLVRVLEANTPAAAFWKKIIHEYTRGQYSERQVVPDERSRIFFSFNNVSRTN